MIRRPCWLVPRAVPAFALVLVVSAAAPSAHDDSGWIQLFNGKNLEGWTPKVRGYKAGENPANTFRVENGVLKVAYDGYDKFDGRFGHLFTKQKYSHYRLRIEYRFVGEQCAGGPSWAVRNSGVMLHSQSPESMRIDQDFPVSIEAQFLGGAETGERPTANVCSPGTHIVMGGKLITQHCNNSKSKTYRGDQWVTVELEVHGGGIIKHKIDGEVVLEYEQPQLDAQDEDARKLIQGGEKLLTEGHLALQSESHPIEFRKVELLPIKD